MNNSDLTSGGQDQALAGPALRERLSGSAPDERIPLDARARAAGVLVRPAPQRAEPKRVDIGNAYNAILRVFETVETLQLRCSVLDAEKTHAMQQAEGLLRDAFTRIRDLEEVIGALMRLVAKYDALLLESADRAIRAENRAAYAELRNKDTDRGASDAVEWLYRYMSEPLDVPR